MPALAHQFLPGRAMGWLRTPYSCMGDQVSDLVAENFI